VSGKRKANPTSSGPLKKNRDQTENTSENFEDFRPETRAKVERQKETGSETDFGLRSAYKKKRQKPGAGEQVDLPQKALYAKTALLPQGLKEKEPQDDQRLEKLLERVAALEAENSRLRAENAQLKEMQDGSVEAIGDSGGVRAVVYETRVGLEDIPEVDLSEVPLFVGGRGTDPMAHLQEHYGQWLAYFGAKEDSVFQDQVRKHDPKLVTTLSSSLSKRRQLDESIPFLSEILPSSSERNTRILASLTVEEVLKNPALARLLRGRLNRLVYPA